MPGFGAVVGSAGAADAIAVRSGTATGATTLENALTLNRTRDQDNLDLLLQMSGRQPVAPAGSALATASALLGTDASLPQPQIVRQRPLRDWEQAAGDIGDGARGDPRGLGTVSSGAAVPQADLRALQEPLLRTVQLVRDNRAWLLGALVLAVILGVAVKVFSRRI